MDKELLFKPRGDEVDVELPGVGTVRIRALTRAEIHRIGKAKDPNVAERRTLAAALVDPVVTEAEVAQWQEAAPAGEMSPIIDAIGELSGLNAESEKEAYKQFRS